MSLRRELEKIEKIKSMSIKNEIDRITTAKQDIKSAIENNGISVPDDAHIDEYSQYIQGLVNPSDVVTSLNGEKGDVKLRPTYYKLNGTPVTDIGGVGQKYPIAISNLTPSSPAPIVGDTVVFYTDSYTYIGTVTEAQTSAVIVEVKVTMQGGKLYRHTVTIIAGTSEEAGYDDHQCTVSFVSKRDTTYAAYDGLDFANYIKDLYIPISQIISPKNGGPSILFLENIASNNGESIFVNARMFTISFRASGGGGNVIAFESTKEYWATIQNDVVTEL